MLDVIGKSFICLYWVVLICFNIRNFKATEAKKRNIFIYLLIFVNFIVILYTLFNIFI